MAKLLDRAKSSTLLRPVLLRTRDVLEWTAQRVGYRQSEDALESAAQRYWVDTSSPRYGLDGQWRGSGVFVDDDRWLDIGRRVRRRYELMTAAIQRPAHAETMVEWGSGGGALAVHFAPLCDQLIGVDVTPHSLAECEKQLRAEGYDHFRPLLIDVATPETALDEIASCDVFICVYVYEVLPSPEYGERVLRIAHRMLRPNGVAYFQIKYRSDDWRSRPKRFGYSLHPVDMTTYRVDEFWELAQRCGFTPHLVQLEPWDPVVEDERYAYYILTKED